MSLPFQEMTSPRRAARRRALTSITCTLLTISRLCLSCHTGWNLVLKGHKLTTCSVSHGGSCQSRPPLRTWFRGRSRTKHWKRQRGTDASLLVAPQQPRIVPFRSNRAVRARTKEHQQQLHGEKVQRVCREHRVMSV